ncbi:MAG: ABC transporter substrate-binding protein [Betaproteobacteria bacterium RIFCSPLOWO2_12_FULL_65_14]|nr:MAG: ABC transporter substrate-binding protein [Betaproteobacteria bacterium RIFCSPLOWO2_12_FULL_65_14]
MIIARLLLVVAASFAAAAHAQSFPAKPIRMLVGYSAGGGADALARIVGAKMSADIGQQVLVDNRPGAGGTIAADTLAKAPPDGHTIMFADSALLIAPAIYAKLPFDVATSFAPVGGAVTTPLVVVVNPAVSAKTTAELIALLKADPKKYSYGSPGIGTVHHLAMELFKKQAGVIMLHVPYKGASAIVPDLISGQIPIGIMSASPALAQAKSGKLRPIALTSRVTVRGADWPALAETLPGFDASPRLFIIAPAATPEPVISQLNAVLKSTLAARNVGEAVANQGGETDYTTAQQLGARMAEETRKWAQVAKDSGAKVE